MGGLSEKANTINRIWRNTKGRLVSVDSGNLLFKRKGQFSSESTEVITAGAISEIYSRLSYDAVGIGHNDLSGGLDLLIQTKDKGVPWTSANLYNTEEKRIFEPYRSKKIDNLSIAIVGMTGPSALEANDFIIRDAASELAILLPELENSFDLILLLASMSLADTVELVERFSQIDIAIAADNGKDNIAPLLSGSALVTQTGNRGRYLGVLSVTWNGSPWAKSRTVQLTDHRKQLKSISFQLNRLQTSGAGSQSKNERIKRLEANRRQVKKQITDLEQALQSGTGQENVSLFEWSFLPLALTGKIDPQIDYIIRDAKKRIEMGGNK